MDYFNKMDGASGYVRASLLGMSQGMSHLHDPMRLHSALHSAVQVSEANKEAGALLRPLSEYPHLPLLPFTTPPFLHHTLDPRLPFPPSAFHPLHHKPVVSSSAGLCLSTPTVTCSGAGGGGSAFSPLPAKCPKMEIETPTSIPVSISASSASIFSHNMLAASIDARNAFLGGLSPPGINSNCGVLDDRRDSPSPRGSHGSRDSPAHARDADTPNSTSDESRGRKLRPGESWCPVCGSPIRAAEYEAHLSLELEKLAQLVTGGSNGGQQQRGSPPTSGLAGLHGPISPLTNTRVKDPGWETYERVRNNRMQRVRSKRKRTGRSEEVACPMCGDRLSSAEDLSHHIEQCLRRGPFLNNRLYLQPGGGGAARGEGGAVVGRCVGAAAAGAAQGGAEDEVVDVEGDGPPMDDYDWPGGRSVRGGTSRPLPPPVLHDSQRELESDGSKCSEKEPRATEERPGENGAGGGGEAVEREMEELKEKIRVLERNNNGDVENHNSKQLFICLVCRNQYDRPAVSIVCWHVMCEACWSSSLGVKTECPQCSQTMASEDLRPIFL